MIYTKNIVDVLHDVSYQQVVELVSKKVSTFINENDHVFLDFSYTIHSQQNTKVLTIVITYKEPKDGTKP